MKNSLVLYHDYLEKFKSLTDEQFGKLIRCMLTYDASGEIPSIDDALMEVAFYIVKVDMDKDAIKSRSGKNHWNWKNGITNENHRIRQSSQYLDFKKRVLKRDKYLCQICGSKNKLHVHHIKPFSQYPDLKFDVNNGITLCEKCHRKVHKKNG